MATQTLADYQAWATIVGAVTTPLTFLALIWYTIETSRLRKAAEKQLKIAEMPIVVLRLSSEDGPLGRPLSLSVEIIRNVGNGPAFNINVSTIKRAPHRRRTTLITNTIPC